MLRTGRCTTTTAATFTPFVTLPLEKFREHGLLACGVCDAYDCEGAKSVRTLFFFFFVLDALICSGAIGICYSPVLILAPLIVSLITKRVVVHNMSTTQIFLAIFGSRLR